MSLVFILCSLFMNHIVTKAQVSLASYKCQKEWICDNYQKEKLGPNYSFSFIEKTHVDDKELKNGNLSGTYVNQLVSVSLSDKNFRNSFWATGLAKNNFQNSDFSNSVMRGFYANKIKIMNVQFENVDFFGSIFVNIRFNNVNFKNVDFRFSDLGFSHFINSDLRGANLKNCNLIGTKFIKVLTDKSTQFPDDFDHSRINP